VVGKGSGESGGAAFIWTKRDGLRDLNQVLEQDYGVDLTDWMLRTAWSISDDGLTIVGTGDNPDGFIEAWIVRLPPACDDDLDNDGDGLADFPTDPGCADATDGSELSPNVACDDGLDNDRDGLIDFPGDPHCASVSDRSERPPRCGLGFELVLLLPLLFWHRLSVATTCAKTNLASESGAQWLEQCDLPPS
jgi:hypothetical protein